MKLVRYDNLIAIKTDSGKVVGYHARNLQVAHLDELVWQALTQAPPPQAPTQTLTEDAETRADTREETLAEVRDEVLAWNREIDPATGDANLPQAVRSFTINIAQVCNLKCAYCAAGGDGTYGSKVKEIDLAKLYEQLRMLLHDIPNGGSFVITFLGGEPLIHPEAITAIGRFARLQVVGRDIRLRFDIVTNGTLVTPDIAELLATLRANVTVSIDGPPEVNDRNRPTRGGLGSTARTLKGLEHLMNVRDRLGSLNAGAVFGKHHLGVVETYRFLQPFDFDSIKIDFAADKDDGEASRAYADAVGHLADLAFREGGERELRRIGLFDQYFRILDGKTRIHNHCGAGKSLLQVDTAGKFYVCQWFVNDKAEEVGHDLFLDHERLKEYEDPLIETNGCGSCWAKHLCGGGCMFVHKLKTGSKHRTDTEFCARTRSIIAKGIEYYAEARYQNTEGDGREVH